MPKNSYFRPLSVTPNKKRVKEITRFGGVDYTTQKFKVADGKAIDLLNYIYKDKVIQKRNGYEEIFKVEEYKYLVQDFNNSNNNIIHTNTTTFNGIWQFLAEDGKVHIVAHIGKLLYEIENIGEFNMRFTPIKYSLTTEIVEGRVLNRVYEYLDYKSFAFVGGNKLWFAGGNKWMCVRFIDDYCIVRPVENSELASIPTSTISITYENSRSSGRMSLDNVNLLQMLRKNKLISGTGKNEDEKKQTDYYIYTLDAPLIVKNVDEDMSKVKITIQHRGRIE